MSHTHKHNTRDDHKYNNEHNHDHDHDHDHNDNNAKALSMAFWLNFIFSIIELVGGVLTNSTAIITDALHDFMDAFAIGMAVFLEKLSGKPPTESFTYGFKRFSLLSALCMSLFLLFGALAMVFSAVESFINPEPVHSLGMIGLAVLGASVNGVAFFNIKNGGGHSHAHGACAGHAHGPNQNSKAIMLHLLEDLLGWVAVLVGAVVIYFTQWYWIDGFLALAIASFIIINACKNIKTTMKILLLATPEAVDLPKLKAEIKDTTSGLTIEKINVWSLDGSENIASLTIKLTDASRLNEAKEKVRAVFYAHDINNVTIECI